MSREQIIYLLKKNYFNIEELVCRHTFQKFGEKAWQFLDTEILHTLLIVRRDILKKGMVCNNYHSGGGYTQRGLRCNVCQIPRDKTTTNSIYLSAHCNGAGFDFTVMGISAEEARQLIEKNAHLLPFPIRVEDKVNWLHIDCYDPMNGKKVTRFKG